MKVKVNDKVKIIAGKDKGKEGKVIKTLKKDDKVIVEGINIITKHVKPNGMGETGGIRKIEAPIHVSNVMLICPSCKEATRVNVKRENGKKVRICKKCGKEID